MAAIDLGVIAGARRQQIEDIRAQPLDVVIIGGGIHGAILAHFCAQANWRVALLEARDFAFGISSRSSKLLHGGIRYLEQAEFALVRRALQERETMLRNLPHLSRVLEFYLPIFPNMGRGAWEMRCGLWLYDFLSRSFFRSANRNEQNLFPKSRRVAKDDSDLQTLRSYGLQSNTVFAYCDAQMDDRQIVIEAIVAAHQLGAKAINFAAVCAIERLSGGNWKLQFHDAQHGGNYSLTAKCLVNLAGPSVAQVHQYFEPWPEEWPSPVYSRGTHLLFDLPWPKKGVILPTPEKGRYYFVLPYFSASSNATLVGPTTREVPENEEDPQPWPEEEEELLSYLARDFPQAGFTRAKILKSYCGMRILAGPSSKAQWQRLSLKKSSAALSRKDFILRREKYWTLLGGKYTTARHTALQIYRELCPALDDRKSIDLSLAFPGLT